MRTKATSYGQFCPVARAAEIVTTRWTPVLLRELIAGSTKFNDLRNGVPLMSPTLLSKRLKELEQVGIIARQKAVKGRGWEYHISESGKELWPIIETLGVWGQKFILSEFEKHELDPSLLMWDIQRRIDFKHFPEVGHFTAHFILRGAPRERRNWWLVIKNRHSDLCIHDPGHEINLYVDACLKPLTEVWMGRLPFVKARKDKDIILTGENRYTKSFPEWFLLSVFASHAEQIR
jgi:DNA-binding HxlR family transcriptional regulator